MKKIIDEIKLKRIKEEDLKQYLVNAKRKNRPH